jgi:hypothetical protein
MVFLANLYLDREANRQHRELQAVRDSKKQEAKAREFGSLLVLFYMIVKDKKLKSSSQFKIAWQASKQDIKEKINYEM